jgi:breast cancer metastasis-suppressor 1-like protein
MLQEQLRQEVEEKIRRLEEDRDSLENCPWSDSSIASANKKRKRYAATSQTVPSFEACYLRDQLVLPDRRKKPVTVNGPYVVYMLQDTEINEDWNLIRRAIKSSGSLSYC